MKTYIILVIICLFSFLKTNSQSEDLGKIFDKSTALYNDKKYNECLAILNQRLENYPNNQKLRVLRVRVFQAQNNTTDSEKDLLLLLEMKNFDLVKKLILNQINLYNQSLYLENFYKKINGKKKDYDIVLAYCTKLITFKEYNKAFDGLKLIPYKQLNNNQKYQYNEIKRLSFRNQITIAYENNSFQKDYPIKKAWNSVRLEYLKKIRKNTYLTRITFLKHFFEEDYLYELESYIYVTDKLYGFANFNFSTESNFYQQYGFSSSIFSSHFKNLEIELGLRYAQFRNFNFQSYTFGLTTYFDKYYLNLRGSIGPKINENYAKNAVISVRRYYQNEENYYFLRLGTGFAPDDTNRIVQNNSNNTLNSYFFLLGISHWMKGTNNLTFNVGYTHDELSNNRFGSQFLVNLQFKKRI